MRLSTGDVTLEVTAKGTGVGIGLLVATGIFTVLWLSISLNRVRRVLCGFDRNFTAAFDFRDGGGDSDWCLCLPTKKKQQKKHVNLQRILLLILTEIYVKCYLTNHTGNPICRKNDKLKSYSSGKNIVIIK